MRAREFIREGGWATKATQGTVITPAIVKATLSIMKQFVADFNRWMVAQGGPVISVGRPTGSSAYHDVDDADKVYGDIDLQMIAPEIDSGMSPSQFSGYWNKLVDQFIEEQRPGYFHPTDNTTGHPIVKVGDGKYVQVDFMWHPDRLANWGAARVTPERGIKGLLTGNMFSVFGEIMNMSIQHAGVQLKLSNNEIVPYSKRKDTKLVTITTEPTTYILDTFNWLAERQRISDPTIDERLEKNPGINIDNVKIGSLVEGVKGFAASLDANDMFGKGDLAQFSSYEDFMRAFIARYTEKAQADLDDKKRDKAETPDAIARANADRKKVKDGLAQVLQMFGANNTEPQNESTELDEMALPADWDDTALGHDKSFKSRVQYALERAPRLGGGSSRVAFTIPDQGRKTVLKVAKNRKGMAQNAAEVDVLTDGYVKNLDIVIPLIDFDKKNRSPTWLQTELAEKASEKKLCAMMHCGSLDNLVGYAMNMLGHTNNYLARRGRDFADNLSSDTVREIFVGYAQQLAELSSAADIDLIDFTRAANWGIYNNKPVVIDLGFTSSVADLYRGW